MEANRIAITYKGEDYLRIIPKKQADGNYQIKFSLLTNSLLISSKKVVVINNFGIAINRFISVSLNSC
jgi:hypothetical protein